MVNRNVDEGTVAKPVVVEEKTAISPASRPRVLLTNDDGIASPGIRHLAEGLNTDYELVVAAPAGDMSGSGTGIGRFDNDAGIEIKEAGWNGIEAYTVDGPPGLAVMAAALGAFGGKADLVIAGINSGVNTGHSVIHSGTVGAVLTARTFGSHGLAVSLAFSEPWHWETAVMCAQGAARWVLDHEGSPMVINLNVPGVAPDGVLGVRWAELDRFGVFRVATSDYQTGRLQFEVGGSEAGAEADTDTALCRDGYVTMTPLTSVEPLAFPSIEAETIISLGRNQ